MANLNALTVAIEKVSEARAAVEALPTLVGASPDQRADLDVAGVSYGAALSALNTAGDQLRIARSLLAYADASEPKQLVFAV